MYSNTKEVFEIHRIPYDERLVAPEPKSGKQLRKERRQAERQFAKRGKLKNPFEFRVKIVGRNKRKK